MNPDDAQEYYQAVAGTFAQDKQYDFDTPDLVFVDDPVREHNDVEENELRLYEDDLELYGLNPELFETKIRDRLQKFYDVQYRAQATGAGQQYGTD